MKKIHYPKSKEMLKMGNLVQQIQSLNYKDLNKLKNETYNLWDNEVDDSIKKMYGDQYHRLVKLIIDIKKLKNNLSNINIHFLSYDDKNVVKGELL